MAEEAGITRATSEDTPGLVACIDAAYASYRAQGLTLPDVIGGIAEAIANDSVWVIREGGHIIAGQIVSLAPPQAYLDNIAIHPSHTGRGLARALLEVACDHARSAGCNVIKLTTHSATPRNVALYEHLGWHVTRRIGIKVAMERALIQS